MPPLILIPVYNHERGLATMLDGLRASGMPCLLVDDGSEAGCAKALDAMVAANPGWLSLHRRARNGGKGAALMSGFVEAERRGHGHVVQIDADGQHDTADLARFVAASAAAPEALILGQPVYDRSVPAGRRIGRYLTHVWVWINTLSLAIADTMCGFRVYPLAPVLEVLAQERLGERMDFDTEIVVRLHWRGLRVVNLPTPVRYPADGVSHFKLWRDNLLISRMHARLFFGMLWRLPRLLARKFA
ncbi:MAG: glycosyltransferase family 2 protein [Xanthomonadales bacterium]|nr:Polyprenol monophosphomannose synthase [Xanthomonadales bacterium]MCC6591835.1 glycosyltransferase family 2 protein [Xanthomonadales bacterium]MCE7931433.1 glycosyltransferase family 2 protein [Xanthomonadales bacterium PRO6]